MSSLRCKLRGWVFIPAILAVVAAPLQVCLSADPPADSKQDADDSSPKDELSDARKAYMLKAMKKFRVVMDNDEAKTATLDERALMRWSNPVGDVADGLLAVYTTAPADRPAMIAHLYIHGPGLKGLEMHEFADLHPGNVTLFRGSRQVWSPKERYSQFRELPDAVKPSENPVLRLSQMKTMAARFEIIDGFRSPNSEPEPQALRMLSRPSYRYGKADGELVDGAIFTYVVATDPEACLLIEIHRKDDKYVWMYGVFPLTIYSLDAKLDGASVWTKPEAMVFGNPTAPHYIAGYQPDRGEPSSATLIPGLKQ